MTRRGGVFIFTLFYYFSTYNKLILNFLSRQGKGGGKGGDKEKDDEEEGGEESQSLSSKRDRDSNDSPESIHGKNASDGKRPEKRLPRPRGGMSSYDHHHMSS